MFLNFHFNGIQSIFAHYYSFSILFFNTQPTTTMFSKSLFHILDKDVLFEKITKLWIEHHQKERGLSLSTEINIDTKILDALSVTSPIIYAVFDWRTFSIHYIGKNLYEKIGYNIEEFKSNPIKMLFKLLKFDHIFFFVKVLFWDKIANSKLTEQMRLESYSFVICGLTFQHKDGHFVKTMIRSYGVEINEKGFPIYGILEITDIGHLFKSNEYWVHVTGGKTNPKSLAFFSNEIFYKGNYLISPRELEVLKLIETGHSSKEISVKMYLSIDTIDKHRKNMLARVGASDSNALIELCKRCDIL
jgi:DNA-binding CsgD family transcriptional regulator